MELSLNKQKDLKDFPIELARLQISLPLLILAASTLLSYGWTLQSNTSLAAPLTFSLFILLETLLHSRDSVM